MSNKVISFDKFKTRDDKTIQEVAHEMLDVIYDDAEAAKVTLPDNIIILATDEEGSATFMYSKPMSSIELIGRLEIIKHWALINSLENGELT